MDTKRIRENFEARRKGGNGGGQESLGFVSVYKPFVLADTLLGRISLEILRYLLSSVFQRFFTVPRFSSTAIKLFFAWLLSLPLRNTSLIKFTGSSAAR